MGGVGGVGGGNMHSPNYIEEIARYNAMGFMGDRDELMDGLAHCVPLFQFSSQFDRNHRLVLITLTPFVFKN